MLQGNGITVSHIIPSLVGLDKALGKLTTNYARFNEALRKGLRSNFQDLVHQRDLILAAVLDPRTKLQVQTVAASVICSIKIHTHAHNHHCCLSYCHFSPPLFRVRIFPLS